MAGKRVVVGINLGHGIFDLHGVQNEERRDEAFGHFGRKKE